MTSRRSRLVPKVVFRVAITATAVPMIACAKEEYRGVAAPAYATSAARPDDAPPAASSSTCPAGSAPVAIGDGGFTCLAMGVAAQAFHGDGGPR